ncbi:MAG: KpsF/GutQ family sugar-phosphate isomerase [Alphaproteobacteria bacterium]|nr:KpsF/GutQ family sugar-phosphate isomerase [Alphaproteobacteria bacterium]
MSKEQSNIEKAKEVLDLESRALSALSQSIDQSFSEAVETIHAIKNKAQIGRLIVAGIGKSGHVARKIAATMASTGTPAYFVHPGEASHGDMGMITENDAVLMLSNSGENNELSDLIHYTRRYDIPLIAITSNPQSTLAKHADTPLIMPKIEEACPNGLAPTTSTTMMIALGDALAVALLERMGLTPEQYKVFHPGGKLGQRLMLVSELMVKTQNLPIVPSTAKMDEALIALTEKNLGAVIISDDSKTLKGIITDGDLKRHMGPNLLEKSVTDIMTAAPKTITHSALAVEAMNIMTKKADQYLSSLIVMDGEHFIGMIRLQDCLQAGLA